MHLTMLSLLLIFACSLLAGLLGSLSLLALLLMVTGLIVASDTGGRLLAPRTSSRLDSLRFRGEDHPHRIQSTGNLGSDTNGV